MRSWLLEERKKKKWTQQEVAKKIGISEAYYSYIESGERQKKMDLVLVVKLSSVFEIPIDRIVELEEAKEVKE